MSNEILPTEIVNLYRIWTSMMYRCHNENNKQYKNYGSRGIFVCDQWKDFNVFCKDVGRRPFEGCHLDRIDNDKGYFKENCRWVTPKVNHRNKRNNKYYMTHIGKLCQSELIETIAFTRKQFQRAIEKYGEEKFLEMFANDSLPKKRIVASLNDIVGSKIDKLLVLSLDKDKSTGARYLCQCQCGNFIRRSRFKLFHNEINQCRGCWMRGPNNPNAKS